MRSNMSSRSNSPATDAYRDDKLQLGQPLLTSEEADEASDCEHHSRRQGVKHWRYWASRPLLLFLVGVCVGLIIGSVGSYLFFYRRELSQNSSAVKIPRVSSDGEHIPSIPIFRLTSLAHMNICSPSTVLEYT